MNVRYTFPLPLPSACSIAAARNVASYVASSTHCAIMCQFACPPLVYAIESAEQNACDTYKSLFITSHYIAVYYDVRWELHEVSEYN